LAPVTSIATNTFQGCSSLVFFDFAATKLRYINSSAFQRCSLDVDILNLFDSHIIALAGSVFNQGLTSKSVTTLMLPPSLKIIGSSAFTYCSIYAGSTL
jgi:hypothetical protein